MFTEKIDSNDYIGTTAFNEFLGKKLTLMISSEKSTPKSSSVNQTSMSSSTQAITTDYTHTSQILSSRGEDN